MRCIRRPRDPDRLHCGFPIWRKRAQNGDTESLFSPTMEEVASRQNPSRAKMSNIFSLRRDLTGYWTIHRTPLQCFSEAPVDQIRVARFSHRHGLIWGMQPKSRAE